MLKVILLFFTFCAAWSRETVEEEFAIRKQMLDKRYQDFYRKQKKDKEFEQTIQNGAKAWKLDRQKQYEHEKKLREAYRAKRKNKGWDISNELKLKDAYEKNMDVQNKKDDQLRQRYIKKRNQLLELEKTGRHIPLEEELGLTPEPKVQSAH